MKRIKDGYIAFINKEGREESEWFGGFELVNGKPKQVRVNRQMLNLRIKQLINEGCKVTIAEISTYMVENSEYAETIDPIRTERVK